MTRAVLAPWTMPSEIVKHLPLKLRGAAATCYAHLDTVIEYNARRFEFMTAAAIAVTAFFSMLISHPRWKLLFASFGTTDMIAVFVSVAVISGILGWKAGSLRGRREAAAAKQKLLAFIRQGGLELEALAHLRECDPREEYRQLIGDLCDEANESYGPSED